MAPSPSAACWRARSRATASIAAPELPGGIRAGHGPGPSRRHPRRARRRCRSCWCRRRPSAGSRSAPRPGGAGRAGAPARSRRRSGSPTASWPSADGSSRRPWRSPLIVHRLDAHGHRPGQVDRGRRQLGPRVGRPEGDRHGLAGRRRSGPARPATRAASAAGHGRDGQARADDPRREVEGCGRPARRVARGDEVARSRAGRPRPGSPVAALAQPDVATIAVGPAVAAVAVAATCRRLLPPSPGRPTLQVGAAERTGAAANAVPGEDGGRRRRPAVARTTARSGRPRP